MSFLLLSLEGRFLLPSPPVTPFSVAPPMGGRGATPPLKLLGEEERGGGEWEWERKKSLCSKKGGHDITVELYH